MYISRKRGRLLIIKLIEGEESYLIIIIYASNAVDA